MANIVTISGMFGEGHTYFADSPVVIDISGLEWPEASPFKVVRIEVVRDGKVIGEFRDDTGGQATANFDIQDALRNIWSDYDFSVEVKKAQAAANATGDSPSEQERAMRSYKLRVFTQYMASDDGGVYTETQYQDDKGNKDIPGGQCLIGGLTEWERSQITKKSDADAMYWDRTGVRNGDASTKPTSSPERVGKSSITSWVDVQQGYTKSIFYPASATPAADDTPGSTSALAWKGHAPIVLRDSMDYTDFLFVNRRGAVETCSGRTLEAMTISTDGKTYTRTERPSFSPSRSLMTVRQGGPRKEWQMSSGYQTSEWAEWWAMEFFQARRWWMLYKGIYTPVIVEPSKKDVAIYDHSKQQMPHVDFTVTLALEG